MPDFSHKFAISLIKVILVARKALEAYLISSAPLLVEVKNLAQALFEKVNFFKPESSRSESKETYLHCKFLKTL